MEHERRWGELFGESSSVLERMADEALKDTNAVKNMWTVIYFDALGPRKTGIREVSLGFGEDEESRKIRDFFDRGNAATLLGLQKWFAGKAVGRN